LRARTQSFIDQATADQLRVLLKQQQRESQQLRDLIQNNDTPLKNPEQERILLDLLEERLRLKQDFEILRGGMQ